MNTNKLIKKSILASAISSIILGLTACGGGGSGGMMAITMYSSLVQLLMPMLPTQGFMSMSITMDNLTLPMNLMLIRIKKVTSPFQKMVKPTTVI